MSGRFLVRISVLAVLGTSLIAGIMLKANLDVDLDVGNLITPGAQSPTAPIIRQDLPGYELKEGIGHDGQSFYAIAREPMHLKDAAQYTDGRPRYRAQRILLPLLAWATHPQGGGRGLVLAQWIWAAIGVALTGIGAAMLAKTLGAAGKAVDRLAFGIPLLPFAGATLDLAVADGLALGLVLCALAFDAMDKRRAAAVAAVLAVLAKEVVLLVLLGWVLWRGRHTILRMFAVPAAVGLAWYLTLRVMLPGFEKSKEFEPLTGLLTAAREWMQNGARVGALAGIASLTFGVIVLVRRGVRSPLGYVVAIQLAFVPMLSAVALANDWNGPRTVAPLLIFSIIGLTVPAEGRALERDLSPPLEARA
jgi:hypothetical protein